jgi:hypothetical protein
MSGTGRGWVVAVAVVAALAQGVVHAQAPVPPVTALDLQQSVAREAARLARTSAPQVKPPRPASASSNKRGLILTTVAVAVGIFVVVWAVQTND